MTVTATPSPDQAASRQAIDATGGLTAPHMLESGDFLKLVRARWRITGLLTAALFGLYYGFVLLVALNKPLLATRVGEVTTFGIVAGVAVLALAWVLTAIYVVWANRHYDPEVERLRSRLRR